LKNPPQGVPGDGSRVKRSDDGVDYMDGAGEVGYELGAGYEEKNCNYSEGLLASVLRYITLPHLSLKKGICSG